MPYYLSNRFMAAEPRMVIVGCGGTGGFVAEHLCRLFTGRNARITLVDHDRVEPHNLLRQNFYQEDVGKFKSQALAERLARAYGRPMEYSTHPFAPDGEKDYPGLPRYKPALLIGCVDNAAARREMAEALEGNQGRLWLIDAGNGTNWGQVLIGNTTCPEQLSEAFEGTVCHRLPGPTLQRPDLLTAVPDTPPDIDCAAALDLTDQDPTINNVMASMVVQVVRRMAAGTCPFMALYLDLEQGTVTPSYATPEAVAQIAGKLPEAMATREEDGYDEDGQVGEYCHICDGVH